MSLPASKYSINSIDVLSNDAKLRAPITSAAMVASLKLDANFTVGVAGVWCGPQWTGTVTANGALLLFM